MLLGKPLIWNAIAVHSVQTVKFAMATIRDTWMVFRREKELSHAIGGEEFPPLDGSFPNEREMQGE